MFLLVAVGVPSERSSVDVVRATGDGTQCGRLDRLLREVPDDAAGPVGGGDPGDAAPCRGEVPAADLPASRGGRAGLRRRRHHHPGGGYRVRVLATALRETSRATRCQGARVMRPPRSRNAVVTTAIRLQFDGATTMRRPTLRVPVVAGCCTAALINK